MTKTLSCGLMSEFTPAALCIQPFLKCLCWRHLDIQSDMDIEPDLHVETILSTQVAVVIPVSRGNMKETHCP